MMEPINTDSILSTALCGVRSAARACPVMRHELVIHTHYVKLRESMSLISINVLYKSLPFLYHLHLMSLRDANEFKTLSCSLQQPIPRGCRD